MTTIDWMMIGTGLIFLAYSVWSRRLYRVGGPMEMDRPSIRSNLIPLAVAARPSGPEPKLEQRSGPTDIRQLMRGEYH